MRDLDIRKELNILLQKEFLVSDPTCLLLDEFGLCQGVARIDVAVINGQIHGYEIKSEQDTLSRVSSQLEVYSKTLDHLTFVTNQKHLESLNNHLPSWCGIMVANQQAGRVRIKSVRKARNNPNVDPYSLAQLLWKDEVIMLLGDLGYTKGLSSKPRSALWQILAESMLIHELSEKVRATLKSRRVRVNWRADQPQKLSGGLNQSISK
jgi:hypothetical protein